MGEIKHHPGHTFGRTTTALKPASPHHTAKQVSVEILKRPSSNETKYDLFQRLNAGGAQANAQELRNVIVIMVNPA
jgi:hypothetical protein